VIGVTSQVGGNPDFRIVQLGVFVMALIHFQNQIGAAEVFLAVMRGMSVEVAGAKHVATAGFNVGSSNVKVWLCRAGRFLLRSRNCER
jgi:hypothetical protein